MQNMRLKSTLIVTCLIVLAAPILGYTTERNA